MPILLKNVLTVRATGVPLYNLYSKPTSMKAHGWLSMDDRMNNVVLHDIPAGCLCFAYGHLVILIFGRALHEYLAAFELAV